MFIALLLLSVPSPKAPAGAVGTNPSTDIDPTPEPTRDGAMTGSSEDTEPTVDEIDNNN